MSNFLRMPQTRNTSPQKPQPRHTIAGEPTSIQGIHVPRNLYKNLTGGRKRPRPI